MEQIFNANSDTIFLSRLRKKYTKSAYVDFIHISTRSRRPKVSFCWTFSVLEKYPVRITILLNLNFLIHIHQDDHRLQRRKANEIGRLGSIYCRTPQWDQSHGDEGKVACLNIEFFSFPFAFLIVFSFRFPRQR